MPEPLVSVLIPCYNSAAHIGEALESALGQTWSNIEVVVVNDGSTDDSSHEVRKFSRPNLKLIERKNRGAAASRNEAFLASAGQFIQFLDADDLISPDKIAGQMQRLQGAEECVASV